LSSRRARRSMRFLNRIVAIGVGETRPDEALHTIEEIL
jgi:hypothetical protein